MGRAAAVAARPDFTAALAALFGVLVFDTLPGLFIGIGVSLLLLLYRASRPYVAHLGKVPGAHDQYGDIARNPENIAPDGIVILRVESGLFFANADWVRDRIRHAARSDGVRAVILDAGDVAHRARRHRVGQGAVIARLGSAAVVGAPCPVAASSASA